MACTRPELAQKASFVDASDGSSWRHATVLRRAFMTTCLAAVLAAACSLVVHAEPIEYPTLTDAERTSLDEGQAIIRPQEAAGGHGVAAVTLGVVDAPPDEVWPVARDCEHFSKFLPNTKTSRRTEENGESRCFDEISLPFPLPNLWADTTSTVRLDPEHHRYQRTWAFVRGTYRHNTGGWTVLPWGPDGQKSLVVYAFDTDPKMLIPDAIIRAAQTGALPKVLVAVRERVKALRTP
jgi:hypothetical protein